MKQLSVHTEQYNYLEKSYKEWLDILGYSASAIASMPMHVRELFHFLEQRKITTIRAVKPRHIYDFIRYVKKRPNQKYGGALSSSSVNHKIMAINAFARYLSANGHHYIDINPRRVKPEIEERTILSPAEIGALYEATYTELSNDRQRSCNQRDRAMIAIFYGCGLRRKEGYGLDRDDIQLKRGLVIVRKGKGHKQRAVPIAGRHLEDIQKYLEEGRNYFLEDHHQGNYMRKAARPFPKKETADKTAFFLNIFGKRMLDHSQRLRKLTERAGINKQFGLHSLRHSIATHLLQSGMDIEEIRKFLGHSTLESTQIYTHIINEIKKREQDEQDRILHIPVK